MTVPTPREVADALGLTDGTWTGENLERDARLDELRSVADAVFEAVTFDRPLTTEAPASARAAGRARQSVRGYLEQTERALADAARYAAEGRRAAAAEQRQHAAVLAGCALARGVEQAASALHRLSHGADRIGTALGADHGDPRPAAVDR